MEQLQENLRAIRAEDPSIPAVEVTGIFDDATRQAVLAMQKKPGLEETGAVGPVLWQQIISQGSGL